MIRQRARTGPKSTRREGRSPTRPLHRGHLVGTERKGPIMYQRILLAYDGSESGQKALLDCRDIAQWSKAALYLIAVSPLPPVAVGIEGGFFDGAREEAEKQRYREILEDGLRRLRESGQTVQGEVLVGDQVDEITRYAKQIGADLIIVGHKHLDGWAARWWRGSSSPALIEHAPCSVLVAIT
jgi:nucleotide-binding universal stress UspA family protein